MSMGPEDASACAHCQAEEDHSFHQHKEAVEHHMREFAIFSIKAEMDKLSEKDRLDVMSDYCQYCGKIARDSVCYCAPQYDE